MTDSQVLSRRERLPRQALRRGLRAVDEGSTRVEDWRVTEARTLRVGELFAGIGGIGLGLQRAGMEISWQVEREEFCQKVLEKHCPDSRKWDDVRTFPPEPFGEWRVDMIAGGFPCPTVSVAGQRKGKDDEDRWLWPEMLRICDLLRPDWVLVENVVGLLSAGDVRGSLFGDVVGGLASLGYDLEWRCLSAAQFGARHVRNRVFLLAYSSSVRQSGQGESLNASHPSPIIKGSAVDAVDGRFGQAWATEPDVGRVVDGVSPRLPRRNRLTALGNAVVPQVTQFIGEQVLQYTEKNNGGT